MLSWTQLRKFCYARRNRCPTRETFPLLSADGNIRWARSKLQPKIRVEGEFLDYAQKVRQRSQFDRYVDVDLNHTGGRLHMQSNKSQRFLKFRTYTIRAIQHEFEGQKEGWWLGFQNRFVVTMSYEIPLTDRPFILSQTLCSNVTRSCIKSLAASEWRNARTKGVRLKDWVSRLKRNLVTNLYSMDHPHWAPEIGIAGQR